MKEKIKNILLNTPIAAMFILLAILIGLGLFHVTTCERRTKADVTVSEKVSKTDDLKKYAAQLLGVSAYNVRLENVVESSNSISGDLIAEGSDKRYFVAYDINDDDPDIITLNEEKFSISNGILSKVN